MGRWKWQGSGWAWRGLFRWERQRAPETKPPAAAGDFEANRKGWGSEIRTNPQPHQAAAFLVCFLACLLVFFCAIFLDCLWAGAALAAGAAAGAAAGLGVAAGAAGACAKDAPAENRPAIRTARSFFIYAISWRNYRVECFARSSRSSTCNDSSPHTFGTAFGHFLSIESLRLAALRRACPLVFQISNGDHCP